MGLKAFMKKAWPWLATAATGGVAIVWKCLSESNNKEPEKKVSLKDLSDEEIYRIREAWQDELGKGSRTARSKLETIDRVLSDRAWARYYEEHPEGPKYVNHQHGWHLPEDDD